MTSPRPGSPSKRVSAGAATTPTGKKPNLSIDTTPKLTPTVGNPNNPSPLSAVTRSPGLEPESPAPVTGMDPDEYPQLTLGDITQGPGWPSAADPGIYSAAEAIQAQRMDTMGLQLSALTGLAMSQIGGSKAAAKVNKVGDYTSDEAAIAKSITNDHQPLINTVMTAFTKDLKRKDRGPNGKPTTRAGANLTKQSTEFVNQLVAAAGNDVKEFLKAQLDQLSPTAVGIFYKSLVQMLVPNSAGGVKKLSEKDTTAVEMLVPYKGLLEDQFRMFVNDDRRTPLKVETAPSTGGKQAKRFVDRVKAEFSADGPEAEDHPVIAILGSMSSEGLLSVWVTLTKSGAAAVGQDAASPSKDSPTNKDPKSKVAASKPKAKSKTTAVPKASGGGVGTKRGAPTDDDENDETSKRQRKSSRAATRTSKKIVGGDGDKQEEDDEEEEEEEEPAV
ncbi:hypothetical protein TI39_contig411g00016 [Zymoseptoria brevis]|uniref:Uncharacterized protein n=1 Tax=Zymoseptoria brevis TaxID=1047168 RepID=A0A0F4GM31_9PEZI|nr:hypothetical protein TI39_contig411g00016 [Zymoseptoria brevis]